MDSPYETLATDFSFQPANSFNHSDGINALYEDGSAKWRKGVPQIAAAAFASWTLTNPDRMFYLFRGLSRENRNDYYIGPRQTFATSRD
jgi:hypothetical protein